tara:strand:+ start:64 stop:894 length:831 start_codon:yes stop_codon:yes gene_type:complete
MTLHSAEKRWSTFQKIIIKFFFNNFVNYIFISLLKRFSIIIDYIIYKNFVFTQYYKREVLTGPFKGIKYSKAKAAGDLLPQLLGTYESELIPFINSIKNNSYEKIFNIGAGDGYYSIGFSFIYPKTKVFAYEINKEVYEFLIENVEFNKKNNQIFCFNSEANENIKKIESKERVLVFSDCEGAEFQIFSKEVIKNLVNSDLIIEIHSKDFSKTSIEKNLRETHEVQRIGYGDSRMVDIKSLTSNELKLKDFAKICRENRSKYHYFLCAKSKNFIIN